MEDNEQVRLTGEVTITVEVGYAKQTFTVTSTTTHNPALAARKALAAVVSDATRWIDKPRRDDTTPEQDGSRRAKVTGSARASDLREQVQMDTATNGDVYVAALSLVAAVKDELWNWLDRQERTFAG